MAMIVAGCALASEEPPAPPAVAGWNEFAAKLQQLPARLLAKLPVSMQNDSQIRQEVGRVALAALAAGR